MPELEGVSTEAINSSASQRYQRFLMLGATQEVVQETVPVIDEPDVSIWRQVYWGPASYSEFFESLGGDPTLRNTRLTYNASTTTAQRRKKTRKRTPKKKHVAASTAKLQDAAAKLLLLQHARTIAAAATRKTLEMEVTATATTCHTTAWWTRGVSIKTGTSAKVGRSSCRPPRLNPQRPWSSPYRGGHGPLWRWRGGGADWSSSWGAV